MTLHIADENRVRTLTLDRPEALNAFNEALYDATADALLAAADDPEVAVVIITGTGRAFSAGQDLTEMQERITNPDFAVGRHGFPGLISALTNFPKPLICAVNGIGLGIGTTILGYATEALRQLLPLAKSEGLLYVELVTDPENPPSRRVIEANGGVLVEEFVEPEAYGGQIALRFRIPLS